jgi:hypothetical protein
MAWRDCAMSALAEAMSARESLTNWRLRWGSTRLTVRAGGGGMPSDPWEEGCALSTTVARVLLQGLIMPGTLAPGKQGDHAAATAAPATVPDLCDVCVLLLLDAVHGLPVAVERLGGGG